jgi:predicted NUDIX family phosphoesterase
MERGDAESSEQWIQPIPVALLTNSLGEYCILRRTRENRRDLNDKLTLVVGGHVDRYEDARDMTRLLEVTLTRELFEEVGLQSQVKPQLVGLVIDNSSVMTSRHVAFVFQVGTDETVRANAPEEFARRSKYSGRFLAFSELLQLRRQFDPWSALVIEDYLAPVNGVVVTRQPSLPLQPSP